MRKLLVLLAGVLLLGACGSKPEPDYTTTEQLESALNDGENPEGKIVAVEVNELVPDSAFGYNIQTGEHLTLFQVKTRTLK